ncbi:hypothetical protein DFH09DRAFT_1365456 [Mycena vulgaris]|nr:hypothetical protein DFH09DRAFT_1365456 [Mycena vulgaris]
MADARPHGLSLAPSHDASPATPSTTSPRPALSLAPAPKPTANVGPKAGSAPAPRPEDVAAWLRWTVFPRAALLLAMPFLPEALRPARTLLHATLPYTLSTTRAFWFRTSYFWEDYPHTHLSGAMKRYYLSQIAYCCGRLWCVSLLLYFFLASDARRPLSSRPTRIPRPSSSAIFLFFRDVLMLASEECRSDHSKYVLHHVITVWMVRCVCILRFFCFVLSYFRVEMGFDLGAAGFELALDLRLLGLRAGFAFFPRATFPGLFWRR